MDTTPISDTNSCVLSALAPNWSPFEAPEKKKVLEIKENENSFPFSGASQKSTVVVSVLCISAKSSS